jgi:hypothetical protein
VSFEVELAQKSLARLRAVITLHSRWRAEGRTAGVIYVCGDPDGADRITRVGKGIRGLEWRGLQVWRLDTLRQETVQLGEQRRKTAAAAGTATGYSD